MLNIVARSTGREADVIWFGSRPVADHDVSTVRYTFTDYLGTPILQTSPSAAIVWRAEYEPFGDTYLLRAGTAPDDQPLRFPGQQIAIETSAGHENYNIFRWYRSGWGRYTQADPPGLGASTSTNLYSYVDARPIVATDRLGLVSSQAECPKNACCTMKAMQEEFQKAWTYALTHQKDYDLSIGSLCSGQSCYDSANFLQKDIEQFVKPKCWITSTQLTKGGPLGKAINPITKWLFGINAWVHYVVKFTPCNADLPAKYIDLYTFPNSGPLSPNQELEYP